MRTRLRAAFFGLATLVVSGGVSVAHAGVGPINTQDIPPPLRPWVPWVLQQAQGHTCPTLYGQDARLCGWPGLLTLALDNNGGRFTQTIDVYEDGLYPLPGNGPDLNGQPTRWPLDVTLNGQRTSVVTYGGAPHVQLVQGRHTLAGRFAWDSVPEALTVPPAVALVRLSVQGKDIAAPQRTPDGRIFLARTEVSTETDNLDLTVHRKVQDGVPLLLTTRLTLAVAGKSRELVLGRVLPDNFEPMDLSSALPAQMRPDGQLVIQVRPGQWVLELVARNVRKVEAITRPDPQGLWKEGEEAWVFEEAPAVRAVSIEGVPALDPQQTTLPPEWRSLPAFAVDAGKTFKLVTNQRGNENPQADALRLRRELWLDFDGGGFTARDHIEGTFNTSWRLSMAPPAQLGRVSMGGQDQFITKMNNGPWGVEIRGNHAQIEADSRIPRDSSKLAAASWQHDFDHVSATLNLPPGWRLFAATGADQVQGSWVQGWSLLDVFLLLIAALAVYRLFGWRVGALAFLALLCTLNEPDAPAWIWLALVVAEALVRVVPEGKLSLLPRLLRGGAWLVLIFVLVPFAVDDVRSSLHPAAAHEGGLFPSVLIGAANAPMQQQFLKGGGANEGDEELAADVMQESKPEMAPSLAPAAPPPVRRSSGKKSDLRSSYTQNVAQYDKSVVVQTGPGVPQWQWQQTSFAFNGPVEADQQLGLWLMPPWLTGALGLFRQALLAALALLMFRHRKRLGALWPVRQVAATAAGVLLALGLAGESHATTPELPPPDVLEDLKQRLLAPLPCAPHCATLDRLHVDASIQTLRLRFEISSLATTALPLPGRSDTWMPTQVTVNGKPTAALRRDDQGVLWLVVEPGTAKVEAEGPWPLRQSFALALPLRPQHTTATLRNVKLDGLHEDGQVSEALQFTRVDESAAEGGGRDDTQAQGLLPLLRVHRRIDLGLRWTVTTEISRVGASSLSVVTSVPLLPGESVTTAGVRLAPGNQAVAVNLAPNEAGVSWTSTLPTSKALQLQAPDATMPYTEVWEVVAGPVWHVHAEGIPQLRDAGGERALVWQPWPQEKLRLNITRPTGVDGQTLTIDSSSLDLVPGPRSTAATLRFVVRTSRGREHSISLPAGAQIQSLSLNGRAQPVRQQTHDDRVQITLPLHPGENQVHMQWRHNEGQRFAYRPPLVDLASPSTNAQVLINTERADRWVLWTAGPTMGPTVFFWSYVLVLCVLGFLLARTQLAPLRWWDWLLLGLGVMQLHFWAAATVAAFFLAMGWRQRAQRPARAWAYNITQLVFVGWALAAAVIVFFAIRQGLLASPDMGVMGNNSSDTYLRWYSDRVPNALPRPLVVSVPIIFYRLAMMAWALWLALAVLRWSRWAWQAFSSQGVLKSMRKRVIAG